MADLTLFSTVDEVEDSAKTKGPIARVAIERALDQTLDYLVPPMLAGSIRIGQRVKVPLGRKNKPAYGYVVEIPDKSEHGQLKRIFGIDDARVLLPPKLMELACWMSRYYCCALGTVIESVVPSAVRKKIGVGYNQMVRLARSREEIQAILEKTRAPKRRTVLARLLQMRPDEAADLLRIAGESGARPATVRKLAKVGLITITAEAEYQVAETPASNAGGEKSQPLELNEDQKRVFDELLPRVRDGGFSVNLLHGVTGSGKTEIYLQCIKEAVDLGRKAIVLVPEIALTPQTVSRFTARFVRVAVLHSGLTGSARHRFWRQVSQGDADVVVGARSAIFAPLPKLGMIVVDEEHEASYKQDTAPRYNARDLAIKRAQLEGVPVLLGSATPSLESWQRATQVGSALRTSAGQGTPVVRSADPTQKSVRDAEPTQKSANYHLLSLPRRVRDLQMAQIELIDMKQEYRLRHRSGLLSARLEHMLRATLAAGHQAILLLNRRGYANFVSCRSCMHLMECKYCDTTLIYHRSAGIKAGSAALAEGVHTGQLHCHYCLAVNRLPDKCPECGKKLSLFGLGTQRVEEELTKKFPDLKFARVDSDTMHNARDYEAVLGRFARREIQVMLGTQMIAKGLDYPNVTLVGVISGDTALSLPDFRAAERTFQLITQVAGRAGRGDAPGRVILQTFLPDDPAIQSAIRGDFPGFAKGELRARQEVGLPPITRMVRIIIRDEDLDKLHERCDELAAAFSAALAERPDDVKLKGPMPCAINRIAGYHRAQILLFSPSAARLQQVLAAVRKAKGFAKSDRIAVDVDPVSVL